MPLKYIYQMPQMVRVTGMIHGLLFVLYVLFVVIVAVQFRWSIWKTTLAFVASLVPFGTFWADVKLFRPENQP